MRITAIVLSIILILTCALLVGCGGGARVSAGSPGDPSNPGGSGGTGGTTGGSTTKSGDGTYTGGGTTTASGIKIVGPNIKFPTKFTYLGGAVQFTATVTSTAKIDSVKAVIISPDGTSEDVPMTGTAPYTCTYTVKGNLRMGGPVVEYKIKVVAADQSGNTATTTVSTLDINPPSALPPDAPF